MRIEDIDKLKENDYIVLLAKSDYDIRESVEYSFKNVIFLDFEPTEEIANKIIDAVNKKNMQLIIFDYNEIYRMLLPYIHKNKKIKWILKNGMAPMTSGTVRAAYTNLIEFYDRGLIDCIGLLDSGAYTVMNKAGYKVQHILLDVEEKKINKKINSNTIGLIGYDYNPNHNIYNELTAVTMVEYDKIKILKNMPATRHFIDFFNIKEKEVNSFEEVINDNFVNLYCNFTLTNNEYVLKSMDLGIPCVLGNTNIFDNYKVLKNNLVLISDDDVNEIANKIKNTKKNYAKIMDEYKKFRKDYKEESKKSIIEFLEK